MRLAAISMTAVLLSGCSWMGSGNAPGKAYHYNSGAYAGTNPGHIGARGGQNPCVIFSPVQPVPTGCHPSQVTLAGSQAGNQAYNMGQSSYATGGFGSHADSAYQVSSQSAPAPRIRKPKLRGTLSFGTERSVAGTLVNPDASTLFYDPSLYNEGFIDATDPTQLVTTTYTSAVEGVNAPDLSFQDIHQSPLSLKGGVEYIVNPKFTVFANAGFTHATGANDASATVIGTLLKETSTQMLDPTGAPTGTPVVNTEFIPNQPVANFVADFSDHRQYDLEVGARKYFNPVYKGQDVRTLTPFVGASLGISRVNDITFKTEQNQLFLENAFEDNVYNYYDIPTTGGVNTLYEADWLVNGALTAGMEYQLTPRTALAFETGLKAYQNRDFVSGTSGDMNVVVPLTLRGSYNF